MLIHSLMICYGAYWVLDKPKNSAAPERAKIFLISIQMFIKIMIFKYTQCRELLLWLISRRARFTNKVAGIAFLALLRQSF